VTIATSHRFPVVAVAYAGGVNRDFDQPSDQPDDAPEDRPTSSEHTDEAMRALVQRLGRPHKSGGRVVERASLLAEGADFAAVIAWIEANGGEAEEIAPAKASRGLHSARVTPTADRQPLRFVVPADALR
jgi:hypothetical protein